MMILKAALSLFILGWLCWFVPEFAHAQHGLPHHILIDGSGSMTGFYSTGELTKLHSQLNGQLGKGTDSNYFIDKNLLPFNSSLAPQGSKTFLRHALEQTLQARPPIIWLVTDNQPSLGNQTDSDQDLNEFYGLLVSERVKRIHLFPLRLHFKGTLYRADGHTRFPAEYDGPRGLLIYALLLDQRAKKLFDDSVAAMKKSLAEQFGSGNVDSIFVKPAEEGPVKVKLLDGVPIKDDKAKLLRADRNRIFGEGFVEGQPISGRFRVELSAEADQLQIDEAEVNVEQTGKFATNDFRESDLGVRITEKKITNLNKDNKLIFDVKLEMPAVHMRDDLLTRLKSVPLRHGDIKGEVKITIEVKGRKNLGLTPGQSESFSTDSNIFQNADPQTQSRIYRLNDIVQRMLPQDGGAIIIRPRVEGRPDEKFQVHLQVTPSQGPAFILILLILLLLGLILAIIWFFRRQSFYCLSWGHQQARACPDFRLWPWTSQPIVIDNRRVATIRKTLGGIRVNAARGYAVDGQAGRPLSPYGSDFSISDQNDGLGMDFHFSRAGMLPQPDSGGPPDDPWDKLHAGGSDRGSSSLNQPAKPIRKPTSGGDRSGTISTSDNKQSVEEPIDLDSLFR